MQSTKPHTLLKTVLLQVQNFCWVIDGKTPMHRCKKTWAWITRRPLRRYQKWHFWFIRLPLQWKQPLPFLLNSLQKWIKYCLITWLEKSCLEFWYEPIIKIKNNHTYMQLLQFLPKKVASAMIQCFFQDCRWRRWLKIQARSFVAKRFEFRKTWFLFGFLAIAIDQI